MAAIGPALGDADADAAFERACGHNLRADPGHRYFVVESAGSPAAAGIAALQRDGAIANLGLMLKPEAWNGRVARPALTSALRYGFGVLALDAIEAGGALGVRERVNRRLLAPYGFEPIGIADGRASWALTSGRWLQQPHQLPGDPAGPGEHQCTRAPLDGIRLRLRLAEARDEALHERLYTDPRVMETVAAPLTHEAARQQFQRLLTHNSNPVPGHRLWMVEDRFDGAGTGLISLVRSGNEAELGLMLAPEAWRHQFGREAIATLLPHAFGVMGVERVLGWRPENQNVQQSVGLLTPLGFQPQPPEQGRVCWTLHRRV